MKSRIVGCALALVLAGVVGSSWADTVTLESNVTISEGTLISGFKGLQSGLTVKTLIPGDPLIPNDPPVLEKTTTVVGAFSWEVTAKSGSSPFAVGDDIYAYCFQKGGDFAAGGEYPFDVNYAVAGSPTGGADDVDPPYVDSTAAQQIQALVTNHWYDSLTSNIKAAAFQLAVWEIQYDAGDAGPSTGEELVSGTNYFGTGIITAEGSGSGDGAAAIGLATEWLNGLTTLPVSTAIALNSSAALASDPPSNVQDLLTHVVPLPAALPVGLATMLGMMVVRKVIRRRA